eukprot:166658_1
MNIFSSIHGYMLESPEGLTNKNFKRKRKQKPISYDRTTLNELISYIHKLANGTSRFIKNADILMDQIDHLNKFSSLSLEKRMALEHSKVKWFVFSISNDTLKQLQIMNVIYLLQNETNVEDVFTKGVEDFKRVLKARNLTLSSTFDQELKNNKQEILDKIYDHEWQKMIYPWMWLGLTALEMGALQAVDTLIMVPLPSGLLASYYYQFSPYHLTDLVSAPEIRYTNSNELNYVENL